MNRKVAVVILLAAGAMAWGAMVASAAPGVNRTPLGNGRALGTPKTFRNLTVIPAYDSGARAVGAYLTLDEGLRTKQVSVQESPGGGSVNTLLVTNTSRKPLFLMAGEVVLGGQQDRCVGRDMLLSSGSKKVPVPVFCVEHGRWTGRAEFAQSAPALASVEIRGDAQLGTFMAAGGPAVAAGAPAAQSAVVSEARVSQAQQKVWDKVAAKNRSFGAAPATGTYRQVLGMAASDAAGRPAGAGNGSANRVAPYVKALQTGFSGEVVGVAVNGRIVAADIFRDPSLFRKLWPKLLRSYATDAAENANPKGAGAATPQMARDFLVRAFDARSRETDRSPAGTTLRLDSAEAAVYRLLAGGEASGRVVHESVLRK